MIDEQAIRKRYLAIKDQLTERGRRLFVAAEKAAAGYGGTLFAEQRSFTRQPRQHRAFAATAAADRG